MFGQIRTKSPVGLLDRSEYRVLPMFFFFIFSEISFRDVRQRKLATLFHISTTENVPLPVSPKCPKEKWGQNPSSKFSHIGAERRYIKPRDSKIGRI